MPPVCGAQGRPIGQALLVRLEPGVRGEVRAALMALPREEFKRITVAYFMKYTGIPINFGIAVALGFIVGTAIAGFIGMAPQGPVNVPTMVTNWRQYVEKFGDITSGAYLGLAVYGFFLNGGGTCYVVRVGSGNGDADQVELAVVEDTFQFEGQEVLCVNFNKATAFTFPGAQIIFTGTLSGSRRLPTIVSALSL